MNSVTRDGPELAEHYDRISDLQFQSGCRLVEMMKIKEGDTVLDVGCGTGRLALHVVEAIGRSGSVTGIDPSPHRLRLAETKLKSHACSNVRFMVGHGEDLSGFSDMAFDKVFYSSVIHWIEDRKAALKEAYRVLRPGGSVGMNTVDRDHHFTMKNILDDLITRKYPEHRRAGDEMAKRLITVNELCDLVETAGFGDVRVDSVNEKHYYSSPGELFDFLEASASGNFMRHVPDSVRPLILDDLGKELEKRRTPAGIELESKMLYATAVKL